jgi:hypothetical protein
LHPVPNPPNSKLMKPSVKTLILFSIFFMSLITANAQLTLLTGNSIVSDVKKVIEEYPGHFENLKGELIVQNPQSSDYQCNFKVTDAEESIITRYSGKKNTVSSWQALMLTTDNFGKQRENSNRCITNLTIFPCDPCA